MDLTTRSLLREAWDALGADPSLLDAVEVPDVSPSLLPSPLPALNAATGAVVASTLAAAVLAAARTGGKPERVAVDPEHVSISSRSEVYARLAGRETGDLFAPLSRFWRTSDGWLRLHANYPWHRDRALAVLGTTDDPTEVASAVASWIGAELEDALAAAGALGSFVRTPSEWAEHPQGVAVNTLPLLEVTRAPVLGVPSSRLDVAANTGARGIRVLDLTRVIAGPATTKALAAYGADVLRIDAPQLPEIPDQALDTLQGKRSTFLDLRDTHDRATFDELLGSADVLVQSYRPGALAALGLGAEELAVRHPQLVVVVITAWGHAGPWAQRRGFDSLVQCASGIASATGDADGRPGTLPAQVLDHGTGDLGAAAAMLALARRELGEGASTTTLSLAQTSSWLQAAGHVPPVVSAPVDPTPYLVDLPGPDGVVTVVSPPGRVGGHAPGWPATTSLGVDRPEWR
jgi:crotonobetainyl-CoA:carnitine CoA-transferase CaiB-like acyl-CoA transferase